MRTFLTVSQGERPQDARPLFASDDPGLIDLVLREVVARIGGGPLDSGDSASSAKVVRLATANGGERDA